MPVSVTNAENDIELEKSPALNTKGGGLGDGDMTTPGGGDGAGGGGEGGGDAIVPGGGEGVGGGGEGGGDVTETPFKRKGATAEPTLALLLKTTVASIADTTLPVSNLKATVSPAEFEYTEIWKTETPTYGPKGGTVPLA